MTEMVDRKYISFISTRLKNFKWVKPDLANCSCPMCGDSKTNDLKARLYFYTFKGSYNVKCHKCGYSTSFLAFLKEYDSVTFSDYRLEKFKQKEVLRAPQKPVETRKYAQPFSAERVKVAKPKLYDQITNIEDLPDDHPAVQYVTSRKIPGEAWKNIYYAEEWDKIGRLFGESLKPFINGPRIGFVLTDENGEVTGIQSRSITDRGIRYLTLKHQDKPKIFGLKDWKRDETTLVFEGAVDSLLFKNSLALLGAFGDASFLKGTDSIFVFDNEPRNRNIVKVMKDVGKHHRVCVWNSRFNGKDPNEMHENGVPLDEIYSYIINNSHKGLALEANMSLWNKSNQGNFR